MSFSPDPVPLAVGARQLDAACGAHAASWKADLCRCAYNATGTPLVGQQALSATGVSLRVTVKTVPSQQWRISRELRERIKLAFDDQGIAIATPA